MKRTVWAGLAGLSGLTLVVVAQDVSGFKLGPIVPPNPQRVLNADAIVVGKVTALEGKTVKAESPLGNTQQVEYQIAVVKVAEALAGGNGLTHVKVGFVVPQAAPPVAPPPAIKDRVPIRLPRLDNRLQPVTLGKGQEVCLFLKAHPKEAFYTVKSSVDVIDRAAPDYAAQVREVRLLAKAARDPMAALKSKDAAERFHAAALQLYRHRTATSSPLREELVPAEESKLILLGIAEGDWTPQAGRANPLHPQTLFYLLRPTVRDGWVQPPQAQDIPDAAKQWLKARADSYRLKRYVPAQKN